MGSTLGHALPSGLRALAANSAATCVAIDSSGASTIDLPDAVNDLFSNVVPAGAGPLDALHPSSHPTAVSLFEVARRHGEAQAQVQPLADPDTAYSLHLFDLSATHGCFIGVVVPTGEASSVTMASFGETPTPRRMEVLLSVSGVVTDIDDAFTKALGWTAAEIVGRSALDFIADEDHERSIVYWVEVLSEPGATRRVRQQWRHRDGSFVWMEATETNQLHHAEMSCVVAELVDISDELAAVTALREREELLARLTEALPTGVLQLNHHEETVFSNQRWFDLTGLSTTATFADFVALANEVDALRLREAAALTSSTDADTDIEVSLPTQNGSHRVCRVLIRALKEGSDESSLLLSLEDVTESHRTRRRLVEQAERDPLTGLLNRSAIIDRIDVCIDAARDNDTSLGVLFVDLDDFKAVNDRHGHATGDELLRQVAQTLTGAVRADDLVGRLGGDEFIVALPRLPNPEVASRLAGRLDTELSSIVVAEGERLITGSVGIAILDDLMNNADQLVQAADEAMYQAKRDRRTGLAGLGA